MIHPGSLIVYKKQEIRIVFATSRSEAKIAVSPHRMKRYTYSSLWSIFLDNVTAIWYAGSQLGSITTLAPSVFSRCTCYSYRLKMKCTLLQYLTCNLRQKRWFCIRNAHLLYDLCVYCTDARISLPSTYSPYSHIIHSSGDARVCLYHFDEK